MSKTKVGLTLAEMTRVLLYGVDFGETFYLLRTSNRLIVTNQIWRLPDLPDMRPKRRFIAQSLSCSPFHRLEMTEILLKGRKTLTHPSIHPDIGNFRYKKSEVDI